MNKKTVKKALLLTVCAILLVVASVMGTLAYLTDNGKVVNTFTAGKVYITLDEAITDIDGKPLDAEAGNIVDLAQAARKAGEINETVGNKYHLIPGSTYTKDPTVTVEAGSEACWLFVKVDNGISAIEGGTTIAQQIVAKGWIALDGVSGVYYRRHMESGSAQKYIVFENFTVDAQKTNTDLFNVKDNNVTVTAFAVQEENVATSVDGEMNKALAAWDIVKPA